MKTFKGTHFEVGKEIGAYYKSNGFVFSPVCETNLLAKQLSFYEAHAPEIVEEFRGIAIGSDQPFDCIAHTFLVNETLFLRAMGERSCSIGGFRDETGKAWVVRNYDWHPAVSQVFQPWKFSFPENDVIAISDMGILGEEGLNKSNQLFLYEDAFNANGLFVGVTFAYCWKEGVGLTSFDAVRLATLRCKTVGETIRLFEQTPLASAKNFFIADKLGDMAVVQHGVDTFDVRYPDADGFLALTNHYVGALEPQDQVRKADPNHATFPRYSRLLADMKKLKQSGSADFASLDVMMTSPDTPVCQYLPDYPIETVWTLILETTAKNYRLIRNPRSAQRATLDFTL